MSIKSEWYFMFFAIRIIPHHGRYETRATADWSPEIVPSSARSTSSTAIPLPPHLVPLLSRPLERIKVAVDDVLPRHKHRTALEDAMFEEDEAELGEDGAVLVQCEFDSMDLTKWLRRPTSLPAFIHSSCLTSFLLAYR